MKTAEKATVLEFLSKVKEIFDEKGVSTFDELGKSKKREVYLLFRDYYENNNFDCCGNWAIKKNFKNGGQEFNITSSTNCLDDDYGFKNHCKEFVLYIHDGTNEYSCDSFYNIDDMIKEIEKIIPVDEVIALLNTSIITTDGEYILSSISLERAMEILDGTIIDSAIGHDATAQIMSDLLDVDVPVNRQMFSQKVGQRAIVFKLHGRPQEGKILNCDEIEAIGYDFKVLTRLS